MKLHALANVACKTCQGSGLHRSCRALMMLFVPSWRSIIVLNPRRAVGGLASPAPPTWPGIQPGQARALPAAAARVPRPAASSIIISSIRSARATTVPYPYCTSTAVVQPRTVPYRVPLSYTLRSAPPTACARPALPGWDPQLGPSGRPTGGLTNRQDKSWTSLGPALDLPRT